MNSKLVLIDLSEVRSVGDGRRVYMREMDREVDAGMVVWLGSILGIVDSLPTLTVCKCLDEIEIVVSSFEIPTALPPAVVLQGLSGDFCASIRNVCGLWSAWAVEQVHAIVQLWRRRLDTYTAALLEGASSGESVELSLQLRKSYEFDLLEVRAKDARGRLRENQQLTEAIQECIHKFPSGLSSGFFCNCAWLSCSQSEWDRACQEFETGVEKIDVRIVHFLKSEFAQHPSDLWSCYQRNRPLMYRGAVREELSVIRVRLMEEIVESVMKNSLVKDSGGNIVESLLHAVRTNRELRRLRKKAELVDVQHAVLGEIDSRMIDEAGLFQRWADGCALVWIQGLDDFVVVADEDDLGIQWKDTWTVLLRDVSLLESHGFRIPFSIKMFSDTLGSLLEDTGRLARGLEFLFFKMTGKVVQYPGLIRNLQETVLRFHKLRFSDDKGLWTDLLGQLEEGLSAFPDRF